MTTYTVQPGDYLSKIALKFYGDISKYKLIAEANNIANPDYIVPGQVLTIPDANSSTPGQISQAGFGKSIIWLLALGAAYGGYQYYKKHKNKKA